MATEPSSPDAHLADQRLQLRWRPYRFALPREMVTSQGAWQERRGWLLRLEAADSRLGWGEAVLPPGAEHGSPPVPTQVAAAQPAQDPQPNADGPGRAGASTHCSPGAAQPPGASRRDRPAPGRPAPGPSSPIELNAVDPGGLPSELERGDLEDRLPELPLPLACALGMALAELDGLGSAACGGWLAAPASAILLPAGEAAVAALMEALVSQTAGTAHGAMALTVKWKVATGDDNLERQLLEELLERLPSAGRLRLDANGGWDRATAAHWAARLKQEPRLDWLEQPLSPEDPQGLLQLARHLPVALDESLRQRRHPIGPDWPGWQVRRPLMEADPRGLLAELTAGAPRLVLSTALETGIGRRFLHHLAGLQAQGPTPTAPGLAPGWRPRSALFSADPQAVWRAAACNAETGGAQRDPGLGRDLHESAPG